MLEAYTCNAQSLETVESALVKGAVLFIEDFDLQLL